MTTPIHAVAFDAFGTIVPGARPLQPYAETLRHFGLEYAPFRMNAMTRDVPIDELVRDMLGREMVAADYTFLREIDTMLAEDCASIRFFDETASVMNALKEAGIPYGIISNLAQPYARPLIDLLSSNDLLPPEPLLLWSFREGTLKPNPDIYERFQKRVGVAPENILMVGDRLQNDYLTPRELGFQARLLVRDRSSSPEQSAAECVADLAAILEIAGICIARPRLDPSPIAPHIRVSDPTP